MRPHTGIYYAKSNKLLRNMRSQRHMAAAIQVYSAKADARRSDSPLIEKSTPRGTDPGCPGRGASPFCADDTSHSNPHRTPCDLRGFHLRRITRRIAPSSHPSVWQHFHALERVEARWGARRDIGAGIQASTLSTAAQANADGLPMYPQVLMVWVALTVRAVPGVGGIEVGCVLVNSPLTIGTIAAVTNRAPGICSLLAAHEFVVLARTVVPNRSLVAGCRRVVGDQGCAELDLVRLAAKFV